jgi:hypothetical protein
MIALLGLCVGSIAGCGGGAGESLAAPPGRTDAETSATPLVPSRTTLDFGIVPQGQERRHYATLKNDVGRRVEIERVETNCDCLRVSLAGSGLDAGEEMMICLYLDLSAASDFVGKLVTEIAGFGSDGKTVFLLRVRADVRPVSSFASFEEIEEPPTSTPPLPVTMP